MSTLLPLIALFSSQSVQAWFANNACYFPDAPHVSAPEWICQPSNNSTVLTEVGYAASSVAGLNFTRDMAMADARIKLATRFERQCGTQKVFDTVLKHSRVVKHQRSPRGGYYVQVGILPKNIQVNCR